MQLEESRDGVMGLHSSDEILLLPNEGQYLVDHDNILILSPK